MPGKCLSIQTEDDKCCWRGHDRLATVNLRTHSPTGGPRVDTVLNDCWMYLTSLTKRIKKKRYAPPHPNPWLSQMMHENNKSLRSRISLNCCQSRPSYVKMTCTNMLRTCRNNAADKMCTLTKERSCCYCKVHQQRIYPELFQLSFSGTPFFLS